MSASAVSGLLLCLANPPPEVGAVAFVGVTPLLWSLRTARPKRGALLGLVFGLVYWGVLMYWLLPFGLIAWLPLVVSQSAYTALFGLLMPLLCRDRSPVLSAVGAAALWTAADWARGTWPVGGFTWGVLGNTQHANRFLLPLASITGVWGITFVVVLVNALLLAALPRVRAKQASGAGLAIIAMGAVLAPALIPLSSATGGSLDVAVVQGNVPLALAHDRLLQTAAVGESHIALHKELTARPPDLAVWPENALADDPAVDLQLGRKVSEGIRSVGAPTLVGAIREAPGDRFYNQVLLYSGKGRIVGRYTKNHLVPFGEYVPFHAILGWTERYRRGNADLAQGHVINLFRVDGVMVGTPICFENAFPDLFRRFVAKGSGLMVVSTNDSSFLFSPASREHVIMSQLRAVETGRWVVHAAVSGQSAIVDPRGRVAARTGLFERSVLRATVPSSTVRTLYVRWGDWFPWACGIGALLVLAATVIRRRGSGGSPPAGEEPQDAARLNQPSSTERSAPMPVSGGAEPRVLVIVPTYNERATIGRVLAGVMEAGRNVEALVVDDGSPDGTAAVVEALAKETGRISMIRRSGKQGLASAYLAGFRKALRERYDVVVEMDADLSHRPEDLPALLQGATSHDLTIGSRYVPGGSVSNWSRARLALSRAGNTYARVALGLPVADATSGFRAYRSEVLEALLGEGIRSEGYAFQVELVYRAWRSGFSVTEVPITFREREHGTSKISRRIVAEALLKITQWALRDRLRGRRPVR
ncbi:MAG TPA: apolipoprotein N-acyltransferase [Actinomycetota bacterium]|nr:apolipoprotein N-acyltransferase [Actinomycetota bacterium]